MASAAGKRSTVRVLDVSRVEPYGADSAAFSIPFTLFDTFWFNLPPTELLLFYRLKDLSPSLFDSVVVPKLKHSLALTLAHYLPLAGTLIWPADAQRPVVLYSPEDAGVAFTVAESRGGGGDFNTLSGAGPIRSVDLHPLVPLLESSRDAAQMLSVQVTLFPNQGFSIGLENHSTFCDGVTLFSFLNSWARTCNEMRDQGTPPPSFDRSAVKDPTGLDLHHLNQWRELSNQQEPPEQRMSLEIIRKRHMVPADMVRATFALTPQTITALREKILLHKPELHLSTFVVFLAYSGTCWINCKQKYTQKSTVRLGTNVNFRALLDPPLPESYFGRCVGWRGTVEKTEEFTGGDQDMGLGFAAERLSQLVQELKQRGVCDDEGVTKVSSLSLKEMFGPEKEASHVVSVAGSGRLEFYGSDYGWGRPVMVDFVHIDRDGAISMMEKGHDKDGNSGGLEVAVALNKHEMETFASLFLNGLPGKGALMQTRKISKL